MTRMTPLLGRNEQFAAKLIDSWRARAPWFDTWMR
jgi:hypothetical protein